MAANDLYNAEFMTTFLTPITNGGQPNRSHEGVNPSVAMSFTLSVRIEGGKMPRLLCKQRMRTLRHGRSS